MLTEPHSIWGRPLSAYTTAYNFDTALERLDFDSARHNVRFDSAQESIRQICELANTETIVDIKASMAQIRIQTLQSILKLTLSPHTLRFLACPSLLSGCIRLMSTVTVSGKPSPFSYEYGYLCFRIVTIAFGICFLKRSDHLDMTIARMLSEPKAALFQVLSESVARVVSAAIRAAEAGEIAHCDWIIGWVTFEDDHAPSEALVSRANASTLLDILWADRKYFLKALAMTYSPGLSGIMFLLWRHLHLECGLYADRDQLRAEHPVSPLPEILSRYRLVSYDDQEDALLRLCISVRETSGPWQPAPMDLEDCRTVLQAYNERLAPTNPILFPPPLLGNIFEFLSLVISFVCPGVEDLIPSLFGSTVGHIREWSANISSHSEAELETLNTIFSGFTSMLKVLHNAPPAIHLEFLEAVIKNDLIDLTARMLIIKPLNGVTELTLTRPHLGFPLDGIEFLLEWMSRRLPKEILYITFYATFPDWLKYNNHLLWRRIIAVSKDEIKHFRLSSTFWDKVGQLLQHRDNIEIAKQLPAVCSYARCPDPVGICGSQFACSKCNTPYCSVRCQTADWLYDGWQKPQPGLCGHFGRRPAILNVSLGANYT